MLSSWQASMRLRTSSRPCSTSWPIISPHFGQGLPEGIPCPAPSNTVWHIKQRNFYRHFHQFQNGVLVRGFGQQAFETKLKGFRHCAAKRAAIRRKCAKACCSRFLPPLLPPVPECSSQATFHAYFRILSGRAMNLPGFMARRIKYEGIAPPLPFDANNSKSSSMRNPRFLGVLLRKYNKIRASNGPGYILSGAVSPEDFAVQELDAALLPKAAAQAIKKMFSEANFRLEPSILAVPVSTPDMRLLAKSPPPARKAEADDVSLLRLEKPRRAKQLKTICAIISERLFPPSPGPGTGRERLRP